jgi:hypothetical protein
MYNSGNSSKNVRGSNIIDGTVEAADLATAVNNDIADGVAGKAVADLALPKAGGTMTGALNGTVLSDTDGNVRSGRKNWIINGDMKVSQRGDFTTATVTTNGDYNIDRWQSDSSVVTETVQDTSRKIKYAATSTATGLLGGGQGIELTDSFLDAKTVTISAKVTSNNPNARISFLYLGGANAWVGGTAHTGGGTEETLTLTVTLPSALTRVKVDVRICDTDGVSNVAITNGDYIEFTDVQLELGSVATDFEHRSYGEELALCQRYYYSNLAEATARVQIDTYVLAGIYPVINLTHPVTMRAAPTVTKIGTWSVANIDEATINFNANVTSVRIQASGTGTGGRGYANPIPGDGFTCEAEL